MIHQCFVKNISEDSIIQLGQTYRGYAQGVASRDYLIFSVIYRVSSWNEWLTRDAVLTFLGQICALVQQTD